MEKASVVSFMELCMLNNEISNWMYWGTNLCIYYVLM